MTQKSFTRNYIFNLLYQIMAIALPLITTPYLSRVLGADSIGQYSFAQSIVSYFALFAALGTTLYGQRLIARANSDPQERSKLFWEVFIFRLLGVIIACGIYCILIIPRSADTLLYIVAAIEIITVAFDITWFYQGMEDFRPIALCTAIGRFVAIVCIFVFVKEKSDLVIYVILYCCSILLGNLISWFGLKNYLVPVRLRGFKIGRHFLPSVSLFASQFAIQIYTVLDKTMIGLITKSDFQNGYYEQSQKLIKVLIAIVTSLGAVMASRVAVLWKENKKDEIYKLLYGSFRLIFALGLPMAAGVNLIISRFVPIFYGAGYESVIPIINVLVLMFPVLGCSNIIGIQLLVPSGREKLLTCSVIAGAAANVILNLIMIGHFQALGAAIASVCAEFIVTAVQFWFVRKEIKVLPVLKIFLRYACFTAVMWGIGFVISRFVGTGITGIIIIIIPCVLVYGLLLLVSKDPIFGFLKMRKNSEQL